jgi:DNA-directed RNA polymerase specialized sigma subunit
VYRAVGGRRSQRLRDLDLRGPIGPLFTRADAGEVLLAHPAASSNLGRPGASSAGELMRMAGAIETETAANETARAAAYWYLIWSAARGIEALEKKAGNRASSTKLDEIETRLLWASRLKSEMVRAETPLLLRTIEAQTGRRLETISGAVLRELVELGIEALIDAVERFDPFKGGRAASPAGIGVTRAISQWLKNNRDRLGSPARAAGKVDLDQFPLPDWSRRLHPWQASLEPPAEVRSGLETLTTRERQVLDLRYGWNGGPPRTVAEIAKELRTTPTRIAAMQRRLVARLAYNVERVPKARRKAKP